MVLELEQRCMLFTPVVSAIALPNQPCLTPFCSPRSFEWLVSLQFAMLLSRLRPEKVVPSKLDSSPTCKLSGIYIQGKPWPLLWWQNLSVSVTLGCTVAQCSNSQCESCFRWSWKAAEMRFFCFVFVFVIRHQL